MVLKTKIGVFFGDLVIGRADLAAMRAPGGPEIHQDRLFILDQFLELL